MKYVNVRSNHFFSMLFLVLLGCLSQCLYAAPLFLNELTTSSEFESLKYEPLSAQYSGVDSIKIIYSLARKKIYYANSSTFPYHYEFCTTVLNYSGSVEQFNERIYSDSKNKRYLLGSLSKHSGQDGYVLEISSADKMNANDISRLYQSVKESFHINDDVRFLINTARLNALLLGNHDVDIISSDELYSSQEFQAVNSGNVIGQLIEIDVNNFSQEDIEPHHILLLNGSLLHIPPSMAVITSEFQTPLSHMAVLSRNRGSVLLALKAATENETINSLLGSWVELSVDEHSYLITPSSKEEYDRSAGSQGRENIVLARDLGISDVLDISEHEYKSISVIGGKAANFAELAKVLAGSGDYAIAPEGAFAIPFYYYQQHIDANQISRQISVFLEKLKSSEINDNYYIEQELARIRRLITDSPIDDELLQIVRAKVSQSGFDRMRFRSSTNAEDLDGFSGAGLYNSVTGSLDAKKKNIPRAIKKVWASVWNYEAFMEREYFEIEQASVAMGILVHRSFPDEFANGVAITYNIYRPEYPAYILNVQLGENSVVNPMPGETTDQIISYRGSSEEVDINGSPTFITYSNLNEGEPILSDEQIYQLTLELRRLKDHFHREVSNYRRAYRYDDFALDIEFKYYGEDRQLYIKQARIYNH